MKTASGLLLPGIHPPQLHLPSSVVKAPKKPFSSALFSLQHFVALPAYLLHSPGVTIICVHGLVLLVDCKILELIHLLNSPSHDGS